MQIIHNIYDRSPRFLRQVYTNAYGINNYIRYRKWNRLVGELEYTERLDRQDQIRYVESRLRDVITHAVENVPFYAPDAALKKDFDSRSIFDILREFPITNKETINRDPEAFLARNRAASVVSRTSGTTGTPFQVHMD